MPLYTTRRIRVTRQRYSTGLRFSRFGEVAKNIRPTTDEPLRLKTFEPDDRVVLYRRKMAYAIDERHQLEFRAVPIEQVYGSVEERILYKALQKRHIPFDFQSSLLGGRIELGGLVADFILLDRPVAIPVQGSFWHEGYGERARDSMQYDLLRLYGYEVDELWDYQIHPEWVFEEWMRVHIDLKPPQSMPVPGANALSGERYIPDEERPRKPPNYPT